MANLKDIKIRIGSVKKTRQITSAMKLVAGARLRGATAAAVAAKPYKEKLAGVLNRVAAAGADSVSDPLLEAPSEVKKILVVVLSSDRGLCGGFNNTLLRRLHTWLGEKRSEGIEIDLSVFGNKGRDYLRVRGETMISQTTDYGKTAKMDLVRPVCDSMVAGFRGGDYQEVYIAYNIFENALVQTPTFAKVLPLVVDESSESTDNTEYLYDPSPAQLLSHLLPLYLQTLVLQSFLENEAGELAARMTAMDNATKNANEMIGNLTLQYNRARQAAITSEIVEIVSGAEALK